MIFCNNCGNPVENGSGFCTECGAPVSTAVPTPPQPTFQQPTPPVYYPPQPAYPQLKPKAKSGSTAKIFGLIALIMLGVAFLLGIAATVEVYGNYPQDRVSEMLTRALCNMVLPLVVSLFIPLVTFILVQTGSTKAAKPFMIVAICFLALQVLAVVYSFIQYSSMLNGADLSPLYSLSNSVNGSGLLVRPYNIIYYVSKAGVTPKINTHQILFIAADLLYIRKNVMSILSLRKLSRR